MHIIYNLLAAVLTGVAALAMLGWMAFNFLFGLSVLKAVFNVLF